MTRLLPVNVRLKNDVQPPLDDEVFFCDSGVRTASIRERNFSDQAGNAVGVLLPLTGLSNQLLFPLGRDFVPFTLAAGRRIPAAADQFV